MCIVSNVGDHYNDKWKERDWYPNQPNTGPYVGTITLEGVSRQEFDNLKKEVEEMKELLKMAKIIDDKTGQPDCEMEDKVAVLKAVAKALGISLEEIFGTDA